MGIEPWATIFPKIGVNLATTFLLQYNNIKFQHKNIYYLKVLYIDHYKAFNIILFCILSILFRY